LLLVGLRFLQGVGLGGEWGGAVLLSVEHAAPGPRGFSGRLPQVGAPAGLLLANRAFAAVAGLPEETLLATSWRIPFLVSLVLVLVGLFVRRAVPESPDFQAVQRANARAAVPAVEALRSYWQLEPASCTCHRRAH
jgi:MFS family permease